jgi:hypothetical protein
VVPAGIAFAVVGLAGSPAVDRSLAEGILAEGNRRRRSCERSVSQCDDAIAAKSLQMRTGDTSAVEGSVRCDATYLCCGYWGPPWL